MIPGEMGMVTPAARTLSMKRRKASISKKNWVMARVVEHLEGGELTVTIWLAAQPETRLREVA